MQEIDDNMKIISARVILLLSYLSTIVAVITAFLVKGLPINEVININEGLKTLGMLTSVGYVAIIFFIALFLLNPSLARPIYNEPKNILNKGMFQYDMVMIKIFETELLQDRIKTNLKKLSRNFIYLKISIFAAILVPIVATIYSPIGSSYFHQLWEQVVG